MHSEHMPDISTVSLWTSMSVIGKRFAGLYKNTATTLQDGHISRRMAFRNAANQEEADEELKKQQVRFRVST